MSTENVALVRQIYAVLDQGMSAAAPDLGIAEMLAELFDADVVYSRSERMSGVGLTGEWRGLDAMVRAGRQWVEMFDVLRIEAEQFIDVGDSVVVFTRHRGTAKGSGLQVDMAAADVVTLRDGRVVRFDQYRDRDEALEAVAGLRQ